MFEKQKYYKLMSDLEKGITIMYVVTMVIAVIIGIAAGVAPLIITIPLGLLISYFVTFATKIKIQEMRWRMDVHDKLNQKNL